MRLSLIAALDRERAIGRDGQLPWRLSADLKRFKALTLGHSIVMGRKTWDSIGRPLPGRRNLVLTRDVHFQAEGAEVFQDLDSLLQACASEDEVFIIGGGEIYQLLLPQAHRLLLTEVETTVEGADAWFPVWDEQTFHESSRVSFPADDKNQHPYHFVEYASR